MGANDAPHPSDGEAPVRSIELDPYSIASTAVSNAEFSRFVTATGYLTYAEQLGHSYVFHLFVQAKTPVIEQYQSAQTPWWHAVNGACWHSPFGSNSCLDNFGEHPVVHISWEDAVA